MSAEVHIFRTSEHERWQASLASLSSEQQDFYFIPEYCQLYETNGDGEAQLFVFQENGDIWLHPFLVRHITHVGDEVVPFACADIQTCYGYGGPLGTSLAPEFVSNAIAAYTQHCRDLHAVTEFVRFHPLLGNQVYYPPVAGNEVLGLRDYVWVNLTSTPEELFEQSYNNVLRTDLRKAAKLGFRAEPTSDRAAFAQFVALYRETMQRLNSHSRYLFSAAYFESLWKLVNQRGTLVVARLGDDIHAAAVFFATGKYAHYYLAASDDIGRKGCASSLVIDQGIRWAQDRGAEKLHLGGGLTNEVDDGLLRFKAKFSPLRARYFIGKQIYDPVAYDWLVKRWDKQHPGEAPTRRQILQRYRDH